MVVIRSGKLGGNGFTLLWRHLLFFALFSVLVLQPSAGTGSKGKNKKTAASSTSTSIKTPRNTPLTVLDEIKTPAYDKDCDLVTYISEENHNPRDLKRKFVEVTTELRKEGERTLRDWKRKDYAPGFGGQGTIFGEQRKGDKNNYKVRLDMQEIFRDDVTGKDFRDLQLQINGIFDKTSTIAHVNIQSILAGYDAVPMGHEQLAHAGLERSLIDKKTVWIYQAEVNRKNPGKDCQPAPTPRSTTATPLPSRKKGTNKKQEWKPKNNLKESKTRSRQNSFSSRTA